MGILSVLGESRTIDLRRNIPFSGYARPGESPLRIV
jgi:hypothetical protein